MVATSFHSPTSQSLDDNVPVRRPRSNFVNIALDFVQSFKTLSDFPYIEHFDSSKALQYKGLTVF